MPQNPSSQEPNTPADTAGTSEWIDNNDLRAKAADLELRYGKAVSMALGSEAVKRKWAQFEQVANTRKKWHNRLGTMALLMLVFSLLYAVFELVTAALRQKMVISEPVENGLLAIGMAPILIAIALSVLGVRQKWMLARYKSERIRHWQFHQLLNGPYVGSLTTAESAFEAAWQDLLHDLDRGHPGMEAFIEHGTFRPALPPVAFQDEVVFRQAWKAYYDLRLTLQTDWFTQEKIRYEAADGRSESAARALVVMGAALTFFEAGLHFSGLGVSHPEAAVWIPAGAIALLLLSAGVRVYRSASGISESAERYKTIQTRLLHFQEHLNPNASHSLSPEEVQDAMVEVERLCHAELVEFLRVSQKSDYLI